MKKLFVIISLLLFIFIIHTSTTLTVEQTQAAQESMQMQKLSIPETIICPDTIKVKILTTGFPPNGWQGDYRNHGNEPWIVVPFKRTEIKGDALLCWYEHDALCSTINAITWEQKYRTCNFAIYQEKPGYFCEEAPTTNGFVCRHNEPIE